MQQLRRAVGQCDTSCAAGERDDEALREQRSCDAAAAGAERDTHCQFLTACFPAHQEQVGNIAAGDEQHDADRGHQNPQDIADVANDIGGKRTHVGAQFESGEVRWKERNHATEIGIGLSEGDTRLQAREGLEPEADTARRVVGQWQRRHDLGPRAQKLEGCWQYADHLGGRAANDEGLADDRVSGTKAALPIAVGEQHPHWTTEPVVLRIETTANDRLHSQQWQHRGGDLQCLDTFRVATAGNRDVSGIPRTDGLE